jgi:hypothetical protein
MVLVVVSVEHSSDQQHVDAHSYRVIVIMCPLQLMHVLLVIVISTRRINYICKIYKNNNKHKPFVILPLISHSLLANIVAHPSLHLFASLISHSQTCDIQVTCETIVQPMEQVDFVILVHLLLITAKKYNN